ncbi:MAG: sulfotransferase domain-containing protein [Planctomycetes bacterium]|nr:sulfotransferase domain-containing protein [Planctomycetota bacterium]
MIGTRPQCFIAGYPESGATWVQGLLDGHAVTGRPKIVHVIRDGRDAAVSSWEKLRRPGTGKRVPTLAEYAETFAGRWIDFIEQVRWSAATFDGEYLELRYEELYRDTANEVTRLLEFAGIAVTPGILRSCVEHARLHASTVGDWRYRFDDETAFRFDAVAGYLLAELGYAEPTGAGLARAA